MRERGREREIGREREGGREGGREGDGKHEQYNSSSGILTIPS